ncbi:type II 3-dehydroquinate dehydratase [Paraclostridium sordellii]|uniref:type II 3-dehydroquinate dehydratase n=1 Tax=Paraclostridium sordellii TaxID=1505 RepID=UPI0005E2EF05|nr:type II 3-dehydroquinate dehydratase [Paeniclostridium sordellii]CEN83818.1 3-dehydroquinate dehydratase AroQ [[Clostridium] sordellii] [Paeniclostridium sordellii]
MKILIINGPNLDMLGKREPDIYGEDTLENLEYMIKNAFKDSIEFEFFQSNHEGYIIDKIHEANENFDGIVINPGAFTHYSYAIADAIKSIKTKVVEVHISNIHKREEFRQKSVTSSSCIGQISGFGFYSYILGVSAVLNCEVE